MTDQPPPEAGATPAPDALPSEIAAEAGEGLTSVAESVDRTSDAAGEAASQAAADVPGIPAATVVAAAAAAPVAAAAAPPVTPPAPVAASGWMPPPPQAPPPAGSGWTPPPAVPVAGAGWSAYAQTTTGPGGPAPGWEYAGFWIRATAYIIDGIILGFITAILWFVVIAIVGALALFPAAATTTDGTLTESEVAVIGVGIFVAVMVLAFLTLVATVLYFVLFWVKRGGTLGQTLLGMRVAREADGAPIGWGAAIVRYVMMLISFWIFYLGVIWVAFEPRKRGWHDMVAGTVVVRRV